MNRTKEIQQLHDKGFVILRAQRKTNAPAGWKHKDGKWGYVEEMSDPSLSRYKQTFSADLINKSHCGFYLGFGDLCCIDLDVKKTERVLVDKLVNKIRKTFKGFIAIETTKSNGYHIYFKFKTDSPNMPDFTQLRKANWIEIYYRKRFIACYLSNSKRYNLIHGDLLTIPHIKEKQHKQLIGLFQQWKGDIPKPRKTKKVVVDAETLRRAVAYVEQIEEKKLDITGDNPKWFRIGKAFASAFGDEGFTLFNRISRFSEKYNEDTIQDDYAEFVNGDKRDRGNKITIATFFHICNAHGLLTLEELQAQKMHPAIYEKEFAIELTKKESMAQHVHILCEEFKQHVFICCLDKSKFYVFETTHWILKSPREVGDIVNNFIDRCEMDVQFRSLFRTVPYRKMLLEELIMTTHVNGLVPHTGDLHEGIFINMENGVLHIDLQTGKRKLLDHEAKYNFTTILPYAYQPAESCEKFDLWMDRQMPDKTNQTAYFAFVASCLTKHKADIIMQLVGPTSTGKSSLIDITRRVVGLDNSAAISASILFSGKPEGQVQAIQMENKLLAYDFDAQPFRDKEMLLKAAAGEPLPGWEMHVTRRPVTNYARILIGMNPANYSVFDPAIARRFITINMNEKFVKDNTIMPEIYENEMAGIFNHVVNIGVRHLIDNKGIIKVTDTMQKATLEFHTNSRDAVRWFNTLYEVPTEPKDSKTNKGTRIQKLARANAGKELIQITLSELYTAFKSWLEDEEGYHVTKIPIRKHFAADLELIGVKEEVLKVDGETVRGLYLIKKK